MINVTLDEFIAASQPYQQQFFVYAVDETSMPILPNGERIAKAAMTTGGFLIQSYITDDVKGHLDTQVKCFFKTFRKINYMPHLRASDILMYSYIVFIKLKLCRVIKN